MCFAGEQSTEFDKILTGYKSEQSITHDNILLSKILKFLKPGGELIIFKYNNEEIPNIEFDLKTNGFVNIIIKNVIISNKPNYEVGSQTKLTLKPKSNVASVWKLEDTLDEEVETIDPDDLLDESDLKKPDPASLRGDIKIIIVMQFFISLF